MPLLTGITWPFQIGSGSFPRTSSGRELIKSSLIAIVTTQKGERRMNPQFGINSFGYVFESLTPIDIARITREVRAAVIQNEPRIDVISVTVAEYPETTTKGILISIIYSVNNEYDDVNIPVSS